MSKQITRRNALRTMGVIAAGTAALGALNSCEDEGVNTISSKKMQTNSNASDTAPAVHRNAGESDKITRDYFDSLLIETRYIDSVLPDTSFELFGHKFSTPVMTAALSHLFNNAPDGMNVYARGAAKSNAVHWVGMGEYDELEQILATGAKSIRVIKPLADRKEIFRKIEHAAKSGCIALGMDVDHSFSSDGNYDNVMGLPMKAITSGELREFISASPVPFIIKGIMSPSEAEKCLKAGAAGIVISHHHGMINYSCPPLMMLPEIRKVTGNKYPIFVDCGFESGMDVYKALALGATAVSVGRHLMPLLKEGADEVSSRINAMTAELAGIMARTGICDLHHFDPTVIHKRNF